jgi:hypothetical protein
LAKTSSDGCRSKASGVVKLDSVGIVILKIKIE